MHDMKNEGGHTKHLKIITVKSNRLIHVLKKTSRRRNQDVHPRQPLPLILQVLPANYEPRRKTMITAYAP